jgi:hypothetical protein
MKIQIKENRLGLKLMILFFIVISLFILMSSCKAQDGSQNPTVKSIILDSLRVRLTGGKIWLSDGRGDIAWLRMSGDSLYLGDVTGEKSLGQLSTGGGGGSVNIAGTPIAGYFAKWYDPITIQSSPTIQIGDAHLQLINTGTGNYLSLAKYSGSSNENEASTYYYNSPSGIRIRDRIFQSGTVSYSYLDSAGFHITKQLYLAGDTLLLDYINAHVQAGTGNVDVSGTPTQYRMTVWTDANTIAASGFKYIPAHTSQNGYWYSSPLNNQWSDDTAGFDGVLGAYQIYDGASASAATRVLTTLNFGLLNLTKTGNAYSIAPFSSPQNILSVSTSLSEPSTLSNEYFSVNGRGRFYGNVNSTTSLFSKASGVDANALYATNITGKALYGYTETGQNIFSATTGIANHSYISGSGTALFLESEDSTGMMMRVYNKRNIFRMSQDSSVFYNNIYVKGQSGKSDTSVCYITPGGKILIGDSIGASFGLTMPLPVIDELLADTLNGEIAWFYSNADGRLVKTYGITNQFNAMEQLQAANEMSFRYINALENEMKYIKYALLIMAVAFVFYVVLKEMKK